MPEAALLRPNPVELVTTDPAERPDFALRAVPARASGVLITVGGAVTAVDEVAAAREVGLDGVVSDHHAPRADGRLPEAEIAHPGVCGYPGPELCGTGVADKLAQALGAPGIEDE